MIIETAEEQCGEEGCLSVPGKSGLVTRPNYVKVRALNEEMEEIELEGEELLARHSATNLTIWMEKCM